jgi:hypothetical protein
MVVSDRFQNMLNSIQNFLGIKGVSEGATTHSITTFSITTLSIIGLFVTLSVNDTQDRNAA